MQKGISQVFRMNGIIYQRDLKYGVLLSVAGGLQKKKRKSNQLCIHSGGRQFKLCKCETLFVFFVMLLLLEIHIIFFL